MTAWQQDDDRSTVSLVITIDTEPDNQWGPPAGGDPGSGLSFRNTRGLHRLLDTLRAWQLPATWLVSYSVARDRQSASLLRAAAEQGDEIGGHLHGWETPPFTPADARAHPYIYEYDPATALAKLTNMSAALEDAFSRRPVSYRSGRWGIDDLGYEQIAQIGYRIDTSVVPGYNFCGSRGLDRFGPDFRRHLGGKPAAPYRVSATLWEVPVSVITVGGLGSGRIPAAVARALHHRVDLPSRIAWKGFEATQLCRLVWVRPLLHARRDLVRAALALVARGARIINLMFHSSETFVATSPKTTTDEGVDRFYGDLEAVVRALRDTKRVAPRTLEDAVARLSPESASP